MGEKRRRLAAGIKQGFAPSPKPYRNSLNAVTIWDARLGQATTGQCVRCKADEVLTTAVKDGIACAPCILKQIKEMRDEQMEQHKAETAKRALLVTSDTVAGNVIDIPAEAATEAAQASEIVTDTVDSTVAVVVPSEP